MAGLMALGGGLVGAAAPALASGAGPDAPAAVGAQVTTSAVVTTSAPVAVTTAKPTVSSAAPTSAVTSVAPTTTHAVTTTRPVVSSTAAPPTTRAVTIPISPVTQASTQPPPSSTTSSAEVATTTSAVPSLLVAGPNDTTPRKDGTTTSDQALTPATKLKLIIGGLVGLALLVLLLTIGYARHTRPDDWEYWDEEDDADTDGPDTGPSGGASTGPATGAGPSVPLLTAPVSAVAAGAALTSSADEPTQAFQPPGTVAAPITIGTSSLPIVTLEDISRDGTATVAAPAGATVAGAAGSPNAGSATPAKEPVGAEAAGRDTTAGPSVKDADGASVGTAKGAEASDVGAAPSTGSTTSSGTAAPEVPNLLGDMFAPEKPQS